MRTIVDIPENHVEMLDNMGKKLEVSRAELVRRAVENYIETEREKSNNLLDQYFGMFKDDPTAFDGLDGLAYQEKIRGEWDERDADIQRRLDHNSYGLHDSAQAPYEHGTPKTSNTKDAS